MRWILLGLLAGLEFASADVSAPQVSANEPFPCDGADGALDGALARPELRARITGWMLPFSQVGAAHILLTNRFHLKEEEPKALVLGLDGTIQKELSASVNGLVEDARHGMRLAGLLDSSFWSLALLSPNGRTRWRVEGISLLPHAISVLDGERLYIAAYAPLVPVVQLVALDAASGRQLWSAPTSEIPSERPKRALLLGDLCPNTVQVAVTNGGLRVRGVSCDRCYEQWYEAGTGRLISASSRLWSDK